MKKYLKPETELLFIRQTLLETASEQVKDLEEEINSGGVQEGNSGMIPNSRRGSIWDDE